MGHEKFGEEARLVGVVFVERAADEEVSGGGVCVGHGGMVLADFFEGVGEAVRIAGQERAGSVSEVFPLA